MPEHIFAIEYKRGSAWPYDYDSHAAFTGLSGADEVAGFDVAVPSLAVYTTWDNRDYRKKVAPVSYTHLIINYLTVTCLLSQAAMTDHQNLLKTINGAFSHQALLRGILQRKPLWMVFLKSAS